MYLTLVEHVGTEKNVFFTHRASHGELGHGDSTTLKGEATDMMNDLKTSYK